MGSSARASSRSRAVSSFLGSGSLFSGDISEVSESPGAAAPGANRSFVRTCAVTSTHPTPSIRISAERTRYGSRSGLRPTASFLVSGPVRRFVTSHFSSKEPANWVFSPVPGTAMLSTFNSLDWAWISMAFSVDVRCGLMGVKAYDNTTGAGALGVMRMKPPISKDLPGFNTICSGTIRDCMIKDSRCSSFT